MIFLKLIKNLNSKTGKSIQIKLKIIHSKICQSFFVAFGYVLYLGHGFSQPTPIIQ